MFPIHLNLGFTVIHNYEGAYFLIAILFGVVYGRYRVKKYGLLTESTDNLIFFSLLGAIIGGRLSHFLLWNIDEFIANPLVFFNFVRGGGISITGGLAGAFLVGWFYHRYKKMNFHNFFGIASPVILLAQGIGRIGCFLNSDAHGLATTLPWGVKFPRYGILIPNFQTETTVSSVAWSWASQHGFATKYATMPLHPTQLYEMLGDFLLAAGIILLFRALYKNKQNLNLIFFTHTGGYALLRFWLEFIRADRSMIISGLGISVLQLCLLLWIIWACAWVQNAVFEMKKIKLNPRAKV